MPERNGTVWTAVNNSIRFTPNAFPHQINWFINAIPSGSNPTINAFLTPASPNRMYVLRLIDGFTQETFLDTLQIMPGYEFMQMITHPSAICKQDSTIKITYTGTNFHSHPLIWDFDGATIVNGTNGEGPGPHELRWDELGSKTITVSKDIPTGCALSSTQHIIGYTPIVQPGITYDEAENKLFTEQNYEMYRWFVNQNLIPNSNHWFISPQQSGEYFVVVTGAFGCKDTSDALFMDVTNISNIDNGFQMYPNPATKNLHFRSNQVIQTASIYDFSGRVVLDITQFSGQSINISNLPPGLYHVAVNFHNQTQIRRKLIVKK
ncbi:MAG: T9SS type A sorting domain-containing protein [Flavobacteriales bacterium]